MKFSSPGILYFLWILVPLTGVMWFGIRKRKKILARYADPELYPVIVPGFSMKFRWIKSGLILGAMGLAVFSLAEPKAGFRWEKISQKGVDIMIALDCSKSMLARDILPSRLEQAKREIIDLLRLMKSDRAGLVAFAGQAVLQCPLTLDHQAFNIFLRVLEPDYLPVGGTNLTAAIETGFKGFEKDSDTEKAIVLITDGEDTAGDVEAAARKMAEQGIRIFTIGVGDPQGAPIPETGGGFKKDDSGNIILSRVDEKTLEKIAKITGGRYVRATAGNMDLDTIYSRDILKTMERKELTQGKKKVWENRFQWFLLPCILLLLLELVIPSGKKLKNKIKNTEDSQADARKFFGGFLFALMGILAFQVIGTGVARADLFSNHVKDGLTAFENKDYEKAKKYFIDAQLESPDDLRLYYNIGSAAYMNKEYGQAEKNFALAAESPNPDLRHKALFNLANTRYRQGQLSQAIAGYESLVKEFPDDKEALENIEFVKKKLEDENKQDAGGQDKEQKRDREKEKGPKEGQGGKENQSKDGGQGENKDQGNKARNSPKEKKIAEPEDRDSLGQNSDEKDQTQELQGSGKAQADKGSQGREDDQKPGDSGTVYDNQAGQKAQDPLLEKRLNRLEDRPGMGMVPVTGSGKIKKDW